MLGEVLFLWCCNLLAHFINTYAVDENVSRKEQLLLAPPPPTPNHLLPASSNLAPPPSPLSHCVCAVQPGLGREELHQVRDGCKSIASPSLLVTRCGVLPPLSCCSSSLLLPPNPPQIAVSVLTYPFILAADITAVNNCG